MRPKNRWPEAHVALKRLYDARVPEGMTQKEFGAKNDIGTQGMVWQYLTGYRPLSYEVAAKFARGLGCSIYEISPDMAEALQLEILPFLGKALRRAAMFAALAVLPALTPSQADASACFYSDLRATVYYVKSRLRRWLQNICREISTRHWMQGLQVNRGLANYPNVCEITHTSA